MRFGNKPLRDWAEADVRTLVNSGQPENSTLEYKSVFYENNDKGNRELLQDICSFANSSGGLIVIGIIEARDGTGLTGIPDASAELGIDCANPEQLLLSVESRIMNAIDERLTVESHSILLESGRRVLLFQVPDSRAKPHRVSYQGQTYFPARRERQRLALNVTEIKEMVIRTASRLDVAETELNRVLSHQETAEDQPLLTVAVIPVFSRSYAIDLRNPRTKHAFIVADLAGVGRQDYHPISASMEGLKRGTFQQGTIATLSHNGVLRTIFKVPVGRGEPPHFNPAAIDFRIRGLAKGCSDVFRTANLGAPVLLAAKLHVSKEVVTNYGSFDYGGGNHVLPFSKIYPPVLLDSLSDVEVSIRPLCDLIHQSFGEDQSDAFNDEGAWVYKRPSLT